MNTSKPRGLLQTRGTQSCLKDKTLLTKTEQKCILLVKSETNIFHLKRSIKGFLGLTTMLQCYSWERMKKCERDINGRHGQSLCRWRYVATQIANQAVIGRNKSTLLIVTNPLVHLNKSTWWLSGWSEILLTDYISHRQHDSQAWVVDFS